MLRQEGPLTVFAPSNRAFAHLPKTDLEALLTNRTAMRLLLARYIARGRVLDSNDTANPVSVKTLSGLRLRADIHGEVQFVNGARLGSSARCSNGVIHILDSFDPALVRQAIAASQPSGTEK